MKIIKLGNETHFRYISLSSFSIGIFQFYDEKGMMEIIENLFDVISGNPTQNKARMSDYSAE
jgi:hypothetical protein